MKYAVYTSEGHISFICEGPSIAFAQAQCSAGQQAVEVTGNTSDATHYINLDTMNAKKREESPCVVSKSTVPADSMTATVLSRLREGSVVTVSGPMADQFTVDGGSAELVFGIPGTYSVTVEAPFPALPKTVTINAT